MFKQDGDVADQRPDKVELERREFEHIDTVRAARLEIEHRHTDVASQLDFPSGGLEEVRNEGRRRRLPVRAGDPDHLAGGARPGKEFHVAEDLDPGDDGPVRPGDGVPDG